MDGAVGKWWSLSTRSFSTLQSVVAVVTGLISIVGAAYSAVATFRPEPAAGEIVAVVREAATEKPVPAAVVEVLSPANALVTTLTPGGDGIARRAVATGAYRVRVVHPDFVETERTVQIQPDAATEVHIALAAKPEPVRAAATGNDTRRPARSRGGKHSVDETAAAVERGIATGRRFMFRFGF